MSRDSYFASARALMRLQDLQLGQQQQQQRRSRSLRTPAHELVDSKKKGASSDDFAASLAPEDLHTGLPFFFMKTSEIYSRIRATRSNPTRREEQRSLAEEIMTRRKVPRQLSCAAALCDASSPMPSLRHRSIHAAAGHELTTTHQGGNYEPFDSQQSEVLLLSLPKT